MELSAQLLRPMNVEKPATFAGSKTNIGRGHLMSLPEYLNNLDSKLAPVLNIEKQKKENAKRWEDAATEFVRKVDPILDLTKKELAKRSLKVECKADLTTFSFAICYPAGGSIGLRFGKSMNREGYSFSLFTIDAMGLVHGDQPDTSESLDKVCSVPMFEQRIKDLIEEFVATANPRVPAVHV